VCPDNSLPLGGRSPILCGSNADSIGCPDGYFCMQGLQSGICCVNVPVRQSLPINAPQIVPRPPAHVPPGDETTPSDLESSDTPVDVTPAISIDPPPKCNKKCRTARRQLLPPEVDLSPTSPQPVSPKSNQSKQKLHKKFANPLHSAESNYKNATEKPSLVIKAKSLFPDDLHASVPVVPANPRLTQALLTSRRDSVPVDQGAVVPAGSDRAEVDYDRQRARDSGYGQPSPQVAAPYGFPAAGPSPQAARTSVFGPPTFGDGQTGGGAVLYTPSGCPDGGQPLRQRGQLVGCGAGFDGSPLCPRGFYCHIDAENGVRVCCSLSLLPGGEQQRKRRPRPAAAAGAQPAGSASADPGDVFLPPTLPGKGDGSCRPGARNCRRPSPRTPPQSYGPAAQGYSGAPGGSQSPSQQKTGPVFGPPTFRKKCGGNQRQSGGCNNNYNHPGSSGAYGPGPAIAQSSYGSGGYRRDGVINVLNSEFL